ncbi:hypothetical protein RHOSPDRAFT_35040 [Rhodotorula sp. JG-1b]|nr:hypothetical protein RHOSPDRAFT_35040 [Rhodotorula sp. JG-1b]
MRRAQLVFLATFAATGALAGPLASRNNGGKSAALTPWPAIPEPEAYTKPSGPVRVYPISVATGLTSEHGNAKYKLDSVGDMVTLDYGCDQAGVPFFDVETLSSPYAQIEIKYTESYNGLLVNQSDGPFPFANGLSSEFRVETLNITQTGELKSFFAQGSQRWQSIKLIYGSGVTMKTVGFISTVDQAPIASKPGYFASSNQTMTDIWQLGPRTQQLACFPPGSQVSTWEVDSENGAYIRGQKPATTVKGANAKNYTLSFETMIDYGGVGWRLDTEIDNIWAEGPYLVLTSSYSEGSFVNYNTSLVPPNTLVLGRGWSLQNQTTLTGYKLDTFEIPFDVTEKEWHTIETDSPGDGTYTVRLDGKQIAHFNLTAYNIGARPPYFPPCPYYSFAFAPWQDQAAWYRNVNVTLASGQNYYSNPMTSEDIKIEYGVATNSDYVCSDAGKRDRFSWLGDRQISARSIEAVGEWEYVWGPAIQAFDHQISSGEIPSNMLFSELDLLGTQGRTESLDLILVDWENKFVSVLYYYWQKTGNDTLIQSYWPQMTAMMSYTISSSIDPVTGFSTNGGSGANLYSTCLMIDSLEQMIEMGQALDYNKSVALYGVQAQLSRAAVERTWNETGGFFAMPGKDYAVQDMSAIERTKIGTPEQRQTFWSKLPGREELGGYVDPPAGANQFDLLGGGVKISMNVAGELLWGLGERGDGKTAANLLMRSFAPQVERNVNYTGAYWEFLSADGTYPGNDLETAQSHYWGGFPTAFMTEYVLGVRPTTPGFVTFEVKPLSDWSDTWVQGRVPTPHGLIYTAWGYDSAGKIHMEVTAPKGTAGIISPPFSGSFSVDGKSQQAGTVTVKGGQGKVAIVQD